MEPSACNPGPSDRSAPLSDFTMPAPSLTAMERRTDPRILIGDLDQQLEQVVEVSGVVQSLRGFKKHSFLVIQDRSGTVQCFVPKSVGGEAELPPAGSFVRIEGKVTANNQAKIGYEIVASKVTAVSAAREVPVFPLDRPIESGLDFQLDNRAAAIRNKFVRAAFQVQAQVGKSFRTTMGELGFTEIHTPKIVAGGTEGGAEVFQVDYFGNGASLAQSPQLYKQIAAAAFERVYEVGAVFRAENSHTARHLTEFTGLDYEMALISDQHDVIDVQERFIRDLIADLKASQAANMELLGVDLPQIAIIPRITWREANHLIAKHGTEDPEKNFDLAVGDAVKKEFEADFVFVTGYPEEEKPFYIMPSKEKGFTESFDLLFRGLELSSGGQRVHDYDQLVERMVERGLRLEDNPGYLQAYKSGMPPHGGAGMGLERLAQRLTGLANIREVTLFPRDVKRLLP